MNRLTLIPRPGVRLDTALVNEWLEARDDVTRLEPDHFVVTVASADIASQAEVWTAHEGEPLVRIAVSMETGSHTYGSSLELELRALCEALAEDFDLVAESSQGTVEVSQAFDAETNP